MNASVFVGADQCYILHELRVFTIIFKKCFPSGLDQETVISELVSCVISETRSIKKTEYTCEVSRRSRSWVKVDWTQKGRIAQRGSLDVRRRIRVSQPCVRCNFERGGRNVYAPLNLENSV